MWRLLLILEVVAGVFYGVAVFAEVKVEEQVVGQASKVIGTAISPRGTHLAALVPKGSRYAVWIDGVEGPKIDEYLGTGGIPMSPPGYGNLPFAWSDDGTRWAYLAKMGSEYVVMVDGKEFARGPISNEVGVRDLKFSAGGKHLLYCTFEKQGAEVRAVIDGKAGPVSGLQPEVVFSPDGTQWAYTGNEPGKYPEVKWAVVGERQVKHFGDNLEFTGNGHLVARTIGSGFQGLTLDGKPVIQVANIQSVWVSKTGGMIAAVVMPKPNTPAVLTLNGKAVPGTEGCQVRAVHFSPDGKRFAAYCVTPAMTGHFMIIDGKKQQEYRAISNFQFSPDSSKAIYCTQTAAGNFLVVEDEESDAYPLLISPVIGGGGKRVGYIARNGAQTFVSVDGKLTERKNADILTFSPDASRYAYQVGDGFTGGLWLDGVEQSGFRVMPPQGGSPIQGATFVYMPGVGYQRKFEGRADNPLLVFSPDNKHYAAVGCPAGKPGEQGFVLDGKLIPTGQHTGNHWMPRFSPDSQHLFCVYQAPGGGFRLDADGQQAVTFAPDTICTLAGNWEFGSDGALTFVAVTDGTLKRYRVTAPNDTNLNTFLTKAVK